MFLFGPNSSKQMLETKMILCIYGFRNESDYVAMMMILHRVCTEFNDLVRWELSFFGNCLFPMFIIPCWLMSLLMTVLDLSILASDCFFKSHEAKRCSRKLHHRDHPHYHHHSRRQLLNHNF